jgi:predicted nucleotidyltransferase
MDRFADLREKVLPSLYPYMKKVYVFGSFARGELTPDSDIEILVELCLVISSRVLVRSLK